MRRIFVSSTLFWKASLDEIFRCVYEEGYDGIEFWAQHFWERQYDINEYLRLSALYPLQTAVHSCSWDLNLSSMTEGIREESVRQVRRSMELAHMVNAMDLTIHRGHMTMAESRDESMRRLQQSLDEIAVYSKRCGVDVSLEIMEKIPKEFITDPAAMREAVGIHEREFYYTLDVAHCDSEQELFEILDTLNRISKIHISNRAGKKYHTPLDSGDYDFGKLLPKLLAYDLPMVVEGYDTSRDFHIFTENTHFLKTHGGL